VVLTRRRENEVATGMGKVVALSCKEMLRETTVHNQESRSPFSSVEQDLGKLLVQIAAGNHHAVAELYDATSAVVFGLALRILQARDAAEDVIVEVYSQVWTQAATYDAQRGTPLAWILTITRSRAIDVLRSQKRARAEEPMEAVGDLPAATPNPEEQSVALERHYLVKQALENLTTEQRQVIELAYFSGLSHSEIAVRLGQPLGTVKTRVRLGMLRLRELLAPLATGMDSSASSMKEHAV
jgi:RNA polymerase sigma-70 factor, ECF subfamily